MSFQVVSRPCFRYSSVQLRSLEIWGQKRGLFNCIRISKNEILLGQSSNSVHRKHSCSINGANTTLSSSNQRVRNLTANAKEVRDDFELIYKLPWIKHFRFISRAKILHVGLVTSMTWPVCYWYSQGSISTPVFLTAVTAASATTLGLVVLSYFFRRVVGQLSVDKSNGTILISTLTFWGNRRNRVFPLEALIPLTDSGIDPKRIFQRLELVHVPDVLLISLQHGKFTDKKTLFNALGIPMILGNKT